MSLKRLLVNPTKSQIEMASKVWGGKLLSSIKSARRKIEKRNDNDYTRECEHCTREISFTEVNNYFQGKKGQEHVLDELNDGDYTDNCIFPGDSVNENITTAMPCPNCKGSIENIELEVRAEGEWDNHSDDSDNDRDPSCNGFFEFTNLFGNDLRM